MAFRRVIIIGSTGQLGHDLMDSFAGVETVGLSHDDVAIEERESVEATLEKHAPDLVINTAAFHRVPECETRQREALLVNAIGVSNVAHACASRGIAFGTLSTDYVFDGTKGSPYKEHDEPHPLSVYGLSKLAGEMLTAAANPNHFIFRTSALFGRLGSKSKGYTFIDRILQQAERGEPVRVVDDVTFSPSYTRDVARLISDVTSAGLFGQYHVTNAGYCTWYDFAMETLQQAGHGAAAIAPISSAEFGATVRRPANSSLANDAIAQAGVAPAPPWQDAIARYLKERPA